MEEPISILVIDDSADDRDLYRRTLERAFGSNIRIAEAANGERGIAQIEAVNPTCVMLDYSLPGLDGIAILKRIREKHPHLPVILLTGYGNEAVAVRAMKEGAQDYLSKSAITAEGLHHIINKAIERAGMQKRIDDQHRSLEIFARALAHDLKEPVRTIRAFAQLIANGGDTAAKQDYLSYITKAGDRIAMLIDAVFQYTVLDDASLRAHEALAMGDIVEAAKVNLAALIAERSATIVWEALPKVTADRTQLLQVFQNLIANAINHADRPVRIHIWAEAEEAQLRVFVQDDGLGIAAEHQEKIFEPFRRLNRSEAHSGLGLAVCKKIVEQHGGKIDCRSEPGAGATFSFTLPALVEDSARPSKPQEKRPAPSDEESGAAPCLANVLLVDDREADIYLTRTFLSEPIGMRCNFFVAQDGAAALAMIDEVYKRGGRIDLILLDINMPIMDGFEMLERLRADQAMHMIPVIMCTGSTYEKDRERARALGATGYLEKPARIEPLKSIIEKAPGIRLVIENNVMALIRAA